MKKIVPIVMLVSIILSGCGAGATPAPTGTSTLPLAPTFTPTLTLTTTPTLTVTPTPPGGGPGWFVFERSTPIWGNSGGGDPQILDIIQNIYIGKTDGTNVLQLTSNNEETLPAWSPDGTHIAFLSRRAHSPNEPFPRLFIMNSDGTDQHLLLDQPIASPVSWSPDSRKIVFSAIKDNSGHTDICILQLDSLAVRCLTTNKQSSLPAWSPDGQQIAFISRNGSDSAIFTINTDGTGLTQLTHEAGSYSSPTWTPDGARIAYYFQDTADRKKMKIADIYVMNADGTTPVRLTDCADQTPMRSCHMPSWSPDGSILAYVNSLAVSDDSGVIYTIRRDGTEETKLPLNSSNILTSGAWISSNGAAAVASLPTPTMQPPTVETTPVPTPTPVDFNYAGVIKPESLFSYLLEFSGDPVEDKYIEDASSTYWMPVTMVKGRAIAYELRGSSGTTTLAILFKTAGGILKMPVDYVVTNSAAWPPVFISVNNLTDQNVRTITYYLDERIKAIDHPGPAETADNLDHAAIIHLNNSNDQNVCKLIFSTSENGPDTCAYDPSLEQVDYQQSVQEVLGSIQVIGYQAPQEALSLESYPFFTPRGNHYIVLELP